MSKSIFASVTFWGAVVAMLSPLLKHFGFALTADDQSSIIGSLATLAGQAAPLVGGVIAIIGRLRASKTVHIITPKFSTPLAGSAMLLFCLLVLPLGFTGCAGKKITAKHAAAAGAGGLASTLDAGEQLNEQFFTHGTLDKGETIGVAQEIDQLATANDVFIARVRSLPVIDASNLPQVLSWFGELSGSVRQANDAGVFHVKNPQARQQMDAWSTGLQGAISAIAGFLSNVSLGHSGPQVAEGITAAAGSGGAH